MRVYLTADADLLRRLRDGHAVSTEVHLAASDDEVDEFEAMTAAAAPNHVVVAAEVERPDQHVELGMVAALHIDADGSGDLAWYAPEEIDQVLGLLGD
jgi:hypothetical protein